jgi:hypothetical protein
MVASGHPDGLRFAVNATVPFRFAVVSRVRNADDLLDFAAEFGLSRFNVSLGSVHSVLDRDDGMPIGTSTRELEAGRNVADLRALHRALRTEAQIRRGMQARRAQAPNTDAEMVRSTPRLDIL